MKRSLIYIIIGVVLMMPLRAGGKDNAVLAREIFDRTYEMVFGRQGCTLRYDVNLVGVYKTKGRIWYKGEKSKFVEGRYTAWNDGVTYTLVDAKKRVVTLHDAHSDKKDKYSSNFKFSPEDYTYSVAMSGDDYEITLKLKSGRKGMKLVKALIDRKTRFPKSLRIKVAFFWAHIKVSDFKSGGISDGVFVFPRKDYVGWALEDKRNEE